jgi:hypothetical protein
MEGPRKKIHASNDGRPEWRPIQVSGGVWVAPSAHLFGNTMPTKYVRCAVDQGGGDGTHKDADNNKGDYGTTGEETEDTIHFGLFGKYIETI